MQQVGEEREKTRTAIETLTEKFKKIKNKVTALSESNDETIGILEKKSLALERKSISLD